MARYPEEIESRTSAKYRKRIRTIIEEQDCGKTEFANLANVNKEVIIRSTVYGIIPSVKSLIKIADKLNVSLDYLLAETDDKSFFAAATPATFHERLKKLADENNVKYSEISNKMPFAKNSIYEWIRTGSLPSLEYLRVLAKYFNVSVDYLLGRTDDRN